MTSTRSTHPFFRRRGHGDQDLARKKLALEIQELRRSPWARPVILVPLFVTLVTVGLSQYLGVFDVERKRIELVNASAEVRNREAELRYREIHLARELSQRQVLELEAQREALKSEGQQLIKDRDRLVQQISSLRVESRNLAVQRQRIEEASRLAKANWDLEQRRLSDIAEDRLDRVVSMLADGDPAKRQAAVMSLRSYLAGGPDAHHLKALLALTGALALEGTVGVRYSLVSAIADVDARVIGPATLTATLQALVKVNRGLVQEIKLQQGGLDTAPLKQERTLDANLQATANAIVALLRKGVRTRDLGAIYLGEVDLSRLDLSGTLFDGSVLTGADFSDSTLLEASFESADLVRVTFERADLREARLTLPFFSKKTAIRGNYVVDRMYDTPAPNAPWISANFRCADLRNADFSGYPLLALFDDKSPYNHFRLWPLSFAYANLQGADFRDVQGFGIWPEEDIEPRRPTDWGTPFGVNGGIARSFRKGYLVGMFSIHPEAPLASDVATFSRSLRSLTKAFAGTNWDEARLPPSLREWLKQHPPAQRPKEIAPDLCP